MQPTDIAHWQTVASTAWGDPLALTPLPGEYDLNFIADAPSGRSVLKVMHDGCAPATVEMQIAALAALSALPFPQPIATPQGATLVSLTAPDGTARLAWRITHLPGDKLADHTPKTSTTARHLGALMAQMHAALATVDHPGFDRTMKWNLSEAAWIRPHLDLIEDPDRRAQLAAILDRHEAVIAPLLGRLPAQVIHNDLNDHNILVDPHGRITGLIDLGDALRAPVIADLAIAAAYLMLDVARPLDLLAALVEGYTAHSPLLEEEIEALWPLIQSRLAVSIVNAAIEKRARPDDPYVTVSEAPVRRLLDRARTFVPDHIASRLRRAAGLAPRPAAARLRTWLDARRGSFAPVFARDLSDAPVLDLSLTGPIATGDPFDIDIPAMTRAIDAFAGPQGPSVGGYGEPRLIYGAPAFFAGAHPASDRRTIHIATDVFLPAGTPVHAPLAGTVIHAQYWPDHLDYGGLVILEHEPEPGLRFQTLYGHLARAGVEALTPGQTIAAGEPFATLGDVTENGGWPPHIHLQLGLLEDGAFSWPGVVDPDDYPDWRDVFPNSAALLNLPDARVETPVGDTAALLARRRAITLPNQKLSYKEPIHMVRGWRQYLFDDRARCHLDAYNNVPHVGHAHPRVVEAITRQIARLATNTRYLSEGLPAYAEALTALVPDPLDTVILVNSGSEANEVALRLARAYTGARDMIVSEHGYHGITQATIDISHYKFARKGGAGQADWVHVAPVPDTFRGMHRGADAGELYGNAVGVILTDLAAKGRRPAAFISEVFPSVGGQIIPPEGYLKTVYDHIHAHGGLAIADEVQTGLGRIGRQRWAFLQQGAMPDIVVLGKPIGNGYPLGAVITRREIAERFATGMEFFTTFGGSNAACAAGLAVLQVLADEDLPGNAETVGAHLLAGLRGLQKDHPVIGEVRGMGLFLGVDLSDEDGGPATEAASFLVNALRRDRILIGSDGPHDNVLKIRPPLCFAREDADHLLASLDRALTAWGRGAK